MSYIDGFVVPVRSDQKEVYREMATQMAEIFHEYGAVQIVEAWGDDVPDGKVTDFKRAVAAEPHESIVFSWIVWPSKQVRDAAKEKMMADERMKPTPDLPFDPKRLIYGGFSVFLDTKRARQTP